jgi:alpha-tubulin suppressor-like RCC1 family protein
MHARHRNLTLFPAALTVLLMLLTVRQSAQSPGMSITPANATITVGQTVQFTANGAVAPTVVSAGGEYTCVRLPDGTARCAGRNQFGQLGDGTWANSSVLVRPSGLTTAKLVAAGDEFSCALLTDGGAKCWGLGEQGQRGDGTYTQIALTPVPVQGLTGATALAAGYNHTCALLTDGTMRCWGSNKYGQIGDPTTTGSAVPVAVANISGVLAFTTGGFHTCALLQARTVKCWGANGNGQLGDGTMTTSFTPVTVSGLSNVASISAGGTHTCAVLVDGSILCWGNNYQGQLGDGSTVPSPTPVQVVGLTNAAEVSAGWAHTCTRLNDSTLRCWGEGTSGQLGNGAVLNSNTPVPVSGITAAVGLTAGWWHHSCALLKDSSVRCWGANEWGQFGNGTLTGSSVPVAMSGPGVTWTSSDPTVATIDGAGRAKGVSPGVTTITATDAAGATARTTLTVIQPHFTLSVTKAGLGRDLGDVSSSPAGISCGTTCAADFTADTVVTLTASPVGLHTDWTGCDTAAGATCTVTMRSARSVTATFTRLPMQP